LGTPKKFKGLRQNRCKPFFFPNAIPNTLEQSQQIAIHLHMVYLLCLWPGGLEQSQQNAIHLHPEVSRVIVIMVDSLMPPAPGRGLKQGMS